MRKILLGIICVGSVLFAQVERPKGDVKFLEKFESYLGNQNIKFFICSSKNKFVLIENNVEKIFYTSDEYYMVSNSGEAFLLKECAPAKQEK